MAGIDFSVIVPVYNAERNIGRCLESVVHQSMRQDRYEVIVVDDGSTDHTATVVQGYPAVRLVRQQNQGPAAARNNGARLAAGSIVMFTDSDCVPDSQWLAEMAGPFERDPSVVGVKGAYRTRQRSLVARFAQLEYEDKYRLLARTRYIDFIDTYSAAYRKDIFLSFGGFDLSFRRAANEDVDLSYRISSQGHHLVFNPRAVVEHIHPARLWEYIRKKQLYAYWRMLAVRNSPDKIISDSHTPQLTKLQPFLLWGALLTIIFGVFWPVMIPVSGIAAALFIISTLPFSIFAAGRDLAVAAVAPVIIAARALAHGLGIGRGSIDFILLRR